jgi:predicted DNA-binding transcriptional regulator
LFISSGLGENKQTTDITNEGFLYAETNPERFLETLRSTINKHLE